MSNQPSKITTISNSGTMGAVAVGRGAIAIHTGGNVSVTSALDAQFIALEQLIEQHSSANELKALLKEAVELAGSNNPQSSTPILDKIMTYGGAIGSIAGGIAGTLAFLK